MSTAVQEISTLLVTKFGVDPLEVRPEVPLRQLGLDSLALEELRLHVEELLQVDLEDAALTPRDTVETLAAATERQAVR